MALKEILLPRVGDSGLATVVAIERCVAMAVDIGVDVSAGVVEADAAVRPTVMMPVDRDETATIENTRLASNARDLLAAFHSASLGLGAHDT